MAQKGKKFEFGLFDGALDGTSIGSSSATSSGISTSEKDMYFDPNTIKKFQAFILFIQQQQGNDRIEALATKVLQAVINKVDQFYGWNISKYLSYYVQEIELNCISEKKIIQLFELAIVLEIREHIRSIMGQFGSSWEVFLHELKDEYILEDID